MQHKRLLSGFAFFMLGFLHLRGQDTLSFSLVEAQDYAMQNNKAVVNARLDAKITKKQVFGIIAEGLPRADADIVYKNQFELPTSLIPISDFFNIQTDSFLTVKFGTQHNMTVDFNVYQPIVDGRYWVGLKTTKILKAITQEQIELTESDIKLAVAKSYYTALVASENVSIIEKNIQSVSKLLAETRELYKNGFTDELSVDRLELSMANLESQQKNINQMMSITKDALKYQIGIPLEKTVELTDDLESLLAQSQSSEETPFNFKMRNEYQLLDYQHRVRGYEATSYTAQYAPALSAFFGYGFNAQRTTFNIFETGQPWYRSGYFGFELKWPIFDSYKKGAMYQQKKLEQEKIKNQLLDFEQQSTLQVRKARSTHQNAMEEFANQKKNMALAEKIYNKVKIMYKEGVGSSQELVDAENSLTETQSNYINALYNLLVAKTELDKALGKY